MSLFAQQLLGLHDELVVDLFAGGGGASVGIEMALGRQVDHAVNHDAAAVALHEANHPQTKHHTCDVFEVDPREVTQGRPIGLLWASPDCTYHSKARGGKPIRGKGRKRRALAWVVTRWAGQVRPRTIMLENVEEFADWGPLVGPPNALRPCKRRKGRTFRTWRRSLERLGYQVEKRELRACDYGAPTIRKRLFVIARCDGQPIVWPEPTHGTAKGLKPFRTAAECIDWTIPMCSIFATREEARAWGKRHGQAAPVRPLAEATMRRVARGVKRYVIDNPRPYIVPNNTNNQPKSIDDPVPTVTSGGRNILVAPVLAQTGYGEREGQAPRSLDIQAPLGTIVGGGQKHAVAAVHLSPYHAERRPGEARGSMPNEPIDTLDTSNRHALVAAFMAKHFTGVDGAPLDVPAPTVTTIDHNALVAAHIQRDFGTSTGSPADAPIGTITSDYGGHAGLVASFLAKYYGTGDGDEVSNPAPTITTKDRFGLVTVQYKGDPHIIADIAMRMLQPRELYLAQGFPPEYRITCQIWDLKRSRLRWLTKTEQVRMVGNSVCPPIASALVRANVPEMIVREYRRKSA